MATINNSQIKERIIKEAKINLAIDVVPSKLGNDVIPVLISNPRHKVKCLNSFARSITGSGVTLYDVPDKKKRIFITSIHGQLTKDVACDNSTVFIDLNDLSNERKKVLTLDTQPLTAGTYQQDIYFNEGLELSPSTIIRVTMSFAAGTMTYNSQIFGYEEEV